MMTVMRRTLAPVALLVVAGLAATGCTAFIPELQGGGGGTGGKASEVTVTWLAVAGSQGTTGETVISRRDPEEPGDFRVEFSSNEVGGIGSQSQAGAWNAAIVSTLLLGEDLEGEFRFETDGFIDGPSAGALTTAGIMALTRGDEISDDVTMTGTINATGTIGPVGGIPEKVVAAGEAGFERVLIPLGQRSTPNSAGELVDVVRAGERAGVEVVEVGDIYEAYEELTGVAIPMAPSDRDPRLDNASYDKVQPQTDAAIARYQAAKADFERLPLDIQAIFNDSGLIQTADGYAEQAVDLQRQGLQAGAFNLATQSASLLEALSGVGGLVTPIYTQGLPGLDTFFTQALDVSAAETEFYAFLDQLSAYSPKNVADVEGLVNGYAGAFDAYSLLLFAQQEIQVLQQNFETGQIESLEALFAQLLLPAMWAELSRAQIDSASSTFEIGRDNPGVQISEEVDLQQVGDFFRRGADANFAAFEETVIGPLGEANGLSNDVVIARLSQVDLNIAAAVSQANVQPAIEQYIGGDKPNAQYATLGYGLSNYVRNQGLMDKYYNNAVLDENFQIVDVQYDAVIGRALDLGRQQLSSEVGTLRDGGTEPVLSVASYEVAGLMRDGTLLEQFDAIGLYNGGFLTSRMMSYLAGTQKSESD
jgi:uncharacterized protein